MKFTERDESAMIAQSREACKRLRKLGTSRKTVATHRLKDMRHLRALEKLATWSRRIGFDRCDVCNERWVHSPLLPTPKQTTAKMWTEVNALKEAISMSGKYTSRQRVDSFINELEQGTASLTDEEFSRPERIIRERRDCAAAHVVVTSIDTAQLCNPRSCSEISFDVHVCTEENTEGRMDPESGELEQSSAGTSQLESSSAGTDQLESRSAGKGFETPGQQCLLNWEIGRTTVDGCLLAGVSINLGGNTFSLTELVIEMQTDSQTSTPSVSSKIGFLQMSHKSRNSEPASEEKGSHRFEKRMYWYYFLFLGELWAWMPGLFLLSLIVCLLGIVLIR